MRRQSKKRRKLQAEIQADREAFAFEFWTCMVCGPEWRQKLPRVLDVHEIVRGGSRIIGLQDRRAWLLLCRGCHDLMDDAELWPVSRQYALKKLRDPEHYDRVWMNLARGRDRNAIDDDEVEQWLTRLRETTTDLTS